MLTNDEAAKPQGLREYEEWCRVMRANFLRERAAAAAGPKIAKPADMRAIVEHVCKLFDVPPLQIYGIRRKAVLVVPRHAAMWLCSECTNLSVGQIARHFHRDHTTVLHGVRVTRERMQRNPAFAAQLNELKDRFMWSVK